MFSYFQCLFHCSVRWIKKDLTVFIIACPAYVFLKTLTESLLNFRSLSFEVNLMCCVKEKYSNLILIFFILISLALPSQCLLPVYILGIRGGTFPFLHTFISIDCWVSDNAIQPSVRWYLPGVSICISNIWWHWPLFRWFVFKGESSSPLKIGFW